MSSLLDKIYGEGGHQRWLDEKRREVSRLRSRARQFNQAADEIEADIRSHGETVSLLEEFEETL